MLLGAASVASIVANYAFLLAAGRILGSESYGSLAALLGLLTVVLLPASALQMAVSRDVSRRLASGEQDEADAFARATLRLSLLATVPLVALALGLALPLAHVLNIKSVGVVALAETALVTALAFPVAMGVLQGRERFRALAALYVVPFVVRLGILAVATAAGYRLGGAVVATVGGAVAGTALAIALIREPLRRGAILARPRLAPFLRYLGPVAVGLIGIAFLTQVDVLVVKARFAGSDAGAYAAASAFARVGFFLPATILAVLFPRTAARQARGEETEDILGRSLLVTAAFCAALAAFYSAAGQGLVVTTFGGEFAKGGAVVAPFALAIGLFSLAHVLVGYHLSRGETRYAWIVAVGVVVQVAVLALFPSSLRQVVWSNLVVGVVLLAAHELLVGSSAPALRAGLGHFSAAAAGLRLRRPTVEGLIVLLVATAFVCLLFWPVAAGLGGTVIGSPGGDSAGGIAWLWQLQREGGFHLFGTTHHTLTSAPFGWDEGNGLNVQWLLPYYPAYLATKVVGEVAAYNLVLLSGYVLSGAAMYLLARYLGCARLVAAWAGLVYVVFPWHLARTPHASLVHLEGLPLLLLSLVAAARRPSWFRFALVGTATLACWLTSGYVGTMAVVAAAAFGAGAALTSTQLRGALTVAGSTASAVAASITVALVSILNGVGNGGGLGRTAHDLSIYGLRPLELVVPSAGNLLLGGRLQSFHADRLHGSNGTETSNYLGLLTIGLALAWLVVAWQGRMRLSLRLRSATAGLVSVVVVALVLALPSPAVVLGHEVWMPSRLLWELVPAFRVPSRWVPLAMAALVALAALGLQAAYRSLDRRDAVRRAVHPASLALVMFAMLVSFFELSISPARPRFRTRPAPPEYAALERTPRGIVAEYPLVRSDVYTFWQRVHGRALLNGAPPETPADDVRPTLLDPAVPGTAEELALLGVSAIVTHADALDYTQEGVRDAVGASWGSGYALVKRLPDGSSVWRVVAPRAPALVGLYGGFADPRPPANGVVGFPLVSTVGVGYVELATKEAGVVRLSFDADPPQGEGRVLRVADAAGERPFTLAARTAVSVLVQIPRGRSLLLVKTDPPPTSEADAIVLSALRAEKASGPPDLRAEQISSDPGF